jgi:prophage DNA circulation protein
MSTYKAQFDDIPLEIQYQDDVITGAYAEQEIVDADGSEFESLGMRARIFTIHGFFKNASYDDYTRFKDAVAQPDTVHNFVHPAEGLVFGVITDLHIRHDDRRRVAEVDFTFREQLQGDFESQLSPLIQPQLEEQFVAGQTQAVDRLRAKILLALGPGASELVSRAVTAGQSLSSQFVDAAAAVRSYVSQVDAAVNAFAGFMSSVEQPASSLIASIEYAATVPGTLIGSVAHALDRYLTLVETAVDSPVLTLQSFYAGALQLRNAAVGFSPEIDNIVAQVGALLAAQLYKEDNDARYSAEVIENASAWNAAGEYVGKAAAPVYLTVEELERSLSTVRSWLQTAYEADREMTVLQLMAAELLRHVNQIKIDRGRTYVVDVPTEMPLHMICHRYGIPQGRVERILSLNPGIKNPSFVVGNVVLHE